MYFFSSFGRFLEGLWSSLAMEWLFCFLFAGSSLAWNSPGNSIKSQANRQALLTTLSASLGLVPSSLVCCSHQQFFSTCLERLLKPLCLTYVLCTETKKMPRREKNRKFCTTFCISILPGTLVLCILTTTNSPEPLKNLYGFCEFGLKKILCFLLNLYSYS